MLEGRQTCQIRDIIFEFYKLSIDGRKIETPGVTAEDWITVLTGPR